MNGMLWTEEVIENNTVSLYLIMKCNQQDNCIKSDIWSDVILIVSITLFCHEERKSEHLEERRKIM